ncbi:uncharacterized protein LOC131017378 isoform X2 [Salvia miltiorrhiza]|uniref:uncharacterized protein LOC131017378 isoform X2 n=1 Tax=Salvia miltiorrhiza TaxID=226208 RepID=UPI0025AC286D|nr:uncharacterized protein LOC131017378 isoform X2 [Salvia miltiorrhiza]
MSVRKMWKFNRKKTNLVKLHLLSNGIDLTYHTWIWHGERSISNYSITGVIEWALKMFNATMQRKGRKTLNWSIPKVPKQSDNSQCGFYVMRYMKDIIESANFERISSLQLLFNSKSYSNLDAKRKEDHI